MELFKEMEQPISEANSLLSLITKLSPPVTVEVYPGQLLVPMPSELKNVLGDHGDRLYQFRPVFIKISNICSSVIKDIRIKFPKETDYAPEIFYVNSRIPLLSTWEKEKCQLKIKSLDPQVSVGIVAYPRIEDFSYFNDKLIVCIISNKIITGLQKKLRSLIQFPRDFFELPKLSLLSLVIPFISILSLGVLLFFHTSDKVILNKAISRLDSVCTLQVAQVTTSLRSKIRDGFVPLDYVLFINNVSTMEELERQDRVVICEPS